MADRLKELRSICAIGYEGRRNPYAYVGNDPLNYTDPSGDCPMCWGAAIGFGVDFAAQAYNAYSAGKPILASYDWKQGAAATVVGAATGGLSALAGGAIGGSSAVAFLGRTVANSAIGAAGNATQTAILNNVDGQNGSYTTALRLGAEFGAAGSVVGDAVAGFGAALNRAQYGSASAGLKSFALDFAAQNNWNPAPAGATAGTVAGTTLSNFGSFVPNDGSPSSGGNLGGASGGGSGK